MAKHGIVALACGIAVATACTPSAKLSVADGTGPRRRKGHWGAEQDRRFAAGTINHHWTKNILLSAATTASTSTRASKISVPIW